MFFSFYCSTDCGLELDDDDDDDSNIHNVLLLSLTLLHHKLQ